MAHVIYVGRKPSQDDCVAGTGAVWVGKGAIIDVSESAIPKLLLHDDVWRLATAEEVRSFSATIPKAAVVVDVNQKLDLERLKRDEQDRDQVIHQTNLQTMTKQQLVEYAMRGFGRELDEKLTIQDMRKKVKSLRIEHSIVNGA